jgi:transposase InsO family protein
MGLHPHLQGKDRGQCPARAIGLEPMAPGWRGLRDRQRACPIRIRTILTDNGTAFTDRLFGLRKRAATGAHAFDQRCTELGIEHRLTPPASPRTNGMVERFNSRIEAVLQSHHFRSGEDLATTLHRYA